MTQKTTPPRPSPSVPAAGVEEPDAFVVDSAKAQVLFDSLAEQAAWFREPSTGSETAKPMKGIFVRSELVIKNKGTAQRLRKGGMLLRDRKNVLQAVQPEYFSSRFLRCFSDGTEICRLHETEMNQAMALSKSNTQIRKRIQEMPEAGFWKSMLKCIPLARNSKKIRSWNQEIHAHISDLSLRKKSGIR